MGEIKMQDMPGVELALGEPKKNKVIRMSEIPDHGSKLEKGFMKVLNRKLTDVLTPGQWKGQRCFIVGGGPSVRNFDMKSLENEHVIAVNLAFRLLEPEIIYGMDVRLWGWIENNETGPNDKEKFDRSKALKIWSDINQAPLPEEFVLAPSLGYPGLSFDMKEGIGTGTNSGFGALNLALLLGASEIYLIGFDFKDGRWHAGYPQQTADDVTHDYHTQCYKENSAEFKKFNSKIYNLNPESALKVFPVGKMPTDLKTEEDKGKPPAVVKRKKKSTDPVFVSYFTAGNGYDAYAKDLVESMKRFDIDMEVQAVKDRGKWDLNTKLKPDFILKMMEAYPKRPIVWVDADAVFLKSPELLYNIKEDVAVHYYKKGTELVSNLVYFRSNAAARRVLRKWKQECSDKKNEAVWDQVLLQRILASMSNIKVNRLPPEYCFILLGKNPEGIDPVVEQRQASRKLKK